MILGIGVDTVEVARIACAMESARFMERIFTPAERELIAEKGAQTAAGRWAAKEAVAKAMGCGISLFPPGCVEILPDEMGKPVAVFSGAALERFTQMGAKTLHLSISHDGGHAVAFALLEGEA